MKKTISFVLALVLVLALVPIQLAPKAKAETSIPERNLITLKKEKSNIAPGITQEIGTVRKKYNEQQLVYYAMTVDLENEFANIHANYKDNDPEAAKSKFGLQTVKAQMDAAQAKHKDDPNYHIVGGINGTGYNMSTGETRGILVMEGQIVHEDGVNSNTAKSPEGFFAIDKETKKAHIYWNTDGTDWKTHKNELQDAINIFGSALIKDGQIVCGTGNSPNARTAIGITADNKVVMLVADGKLAPYSEGCDMYELALILKKAGCVNAMNLDGGGSTTYVARPEGEETYRVLNTPCDGAPRSVSASLFAVSTAGDPNKFDRVAIDADADYITPGGTVNFTAAGISAAGTPIEIPEGVTWSCDAGAGEFTSNGSTAAFVAGAGQTEEDKTVTISMMQDGKTVGEFTVHVVKPNEFKFTREKYMVPFGASMPLEVYAAYKTTVEGEEIESEVTLHDGDVEFKLSDERLGTLKNEYFTAHVEGAEDAVDNGQVTATLICTGNTVTAELGLGKSSEKVFDFENADQISYFSTKCDSTAKDDCMTLEWVSAEEGHVHSGDHAMRVSLNLKNLDWIATGGAGSAANNKLNYIGSDVKLEGAIGFGCWIWIPDEELNYAIAPAFGGAAYYNSYERKGSLYDEGHWEWLHMQPEVVAGIEDFTIKTGQYIGFWLFSSDDPDVYRNIANDLVFYIDDFMVDYSQVQPDREAPTIGDVKTGSQILSRGEVFDFGSTNTVSFNAKVTEDSSFNATGIDESSLKALIDGNEVDVSLTNGQIMVNPVTVADGVHTLKLYVSDIEGNTTNQTRQFKVNAGSKTPTIQVVPHDPKADKLLAQSIYYVDVNATDIATVQEVELTLDLINSAEWELDHIDIDPKFKLESKTIDEYENIATLKFVRTGDWAEKDSSTIASIPIRIWGYSYDADTAPGWDIDHFTPKHLELDVDCGKLTNTDGSTTAFGMAHLKVATELFGEPKQIKEADPNMTGWHNHYEGRYSIKELDKVEPTCTTNGYENRKVCTECNSPVTEEDWGQVLPATGHKYEEVDGVLKCTNENNGEVCGLPYNGIWEETGKLYKDGKVVEGWQEDGTYYVDGKPLGHGLHQVEDEDGIKRWYLFGEDGVCGEDDREGYSGYYTLGENDVRTPVEKLPENVDLEANEYYYIEAGLPHPGWLFFRADGSTVDPDESTETVPPEEEPETKDSEGTTSETNPGVEPGMPDPNQQQAIMDIVAYHVHPDGRVHSVSKRDTRECVKSGYIEYTCNDCKEQEESEKLWWIGHDWDIREDGTRKCKTCQLEGMDIGEATLNIMGENFEYTGGEIRAAVLVYYKGLSLSVRSDKNGLNGYVWYENNKDIGVATVHIRGEGDFYGNLSGTFNIVPKSVKTVSKTETKGSDKDVTIQLTWDEALGADYYTVIRYDYDAKEWKEVGPEVKETSFSETLPLNTRYYYQVASRAVRDDTIFYAANWSSPVSGTVKHVWGEETNKVEATCQKEGSYEHTCTVCQFHETVTVPKLEHQVEEWEVTKEPTTSEEGERQGVCTVCHETVTESIEKLPPISTGTGGSTAPSNKQETVTNPDGSTTTTTTKPDGSTTETTTQTDGTVTEKNTAKSGVVTETTKKTDGTVTEKVTQTDGSATERTTTPEGVTGQVDTDNKGEVKAAEVVIPKEAEKQGTVTAPVEVPAVKDAEKAPEISVKTESSESTRVEIPVTEFGPGTVAVLVHPDGTEEVVRDCVTGENGVVLNVEGDVTLKIVDNTQTFADVESANHWATGAVEFVAARNLFNGTGVNEFSPDGEMTRGMLVTVLHRLAYEPEQGTVDFADVDGAAYYANAVAWAASTGVVNGVENDSFAPEDEVTREQLVTILYRYAGMKGYDTKASGSLSRFTDAETVSDYAREAMDWAVGTGLITGDTTTTVSPTGDASRAQVATILMRFCEMIVK